MRPPCLVALLLAFPATAFAEVYRCEVEGRTVYTDRPCAADSRPHRLPPATIIERPAGAEEDLARRYDEDARRRREARDKADARWLKEHKARRRHEARIRKALIDGRVVPGMTGDQVRSVLGDPAEVTRQERDGVVRERWTYRSGSRTRSVHFKDGYVTSSGSRSREKR